jgi:hypothetical protein
MAPALFLVVVAGTENERASETMAIYVSAVLLPTVATLVLAGGRAYVQAGAGVVADSVPEREHDEVLAKSAILRRALELAEEGL